jgi:uncharacterized cupin superfamily protein
LLELEPGAWSSQRHWHPEVDEFAYVLRGPVVLVTNSSETVLHGDDCAGFAHGEADGRHPQNRGTETVLVLEIGTAGSGDRLAEYPDIDLCATPAGYVRKDGRPY